MDIPQWNSDWCSFSESCQILDNFMVIFSKHYVGSSPQTPACPDDVLEDLASSRTLWSNPLWFMEQTNQSRTRSVVGWVYGSPALPHPLFWDDTLKASAFHDLFDRIIWCAYQYQSHSCCLRKILDGCVGDHTDKPCLLGPITCKEHSNTLSHLSLNPETSLK